MSDPVRPGGPAPTGSARSPGLEGLRQLQQAFAGQEKARLERLEARFDDPQCQAEMVSRVLPRAIALRSQDEGQLAQALRPTFESSLQDSARRNPGPIIDALFPVMGPAIRKAISHALSALVQRFNQALSYSLSARSVRWRIEALRTGRPFAEVVLLKTLAYRVEQVLLIHRESGLLLEHVYHDDVSPEDPKLVSAMLTAIREFSREAFREKADLQGLQVGELSVWLEASSDILLAGVVRGHPPETLRPLLQETLEQVQLEVGDRCHDFRGDIRPFYVARPLLRACLISAASPQRGRNTVGKVVAAVCLLLVALLIASATIAQLRARSVFRQAIAALEEEPGLVVLEARREHDRYRVTGLRDPLSREPTEVLRRRALDPGRLVGSWLPFYSLEGPLIERRAESALQPPPSVALRYRDGTLEATGKASWSWVQRARRGALLLPGVSRFSTEGLTVSRPRRLARQPVPCPDGVGRCFREIG